MFNIDEKEFSLIYYSDTLDIRHYNNNFDDGRSIERFIEQDDDYYDYEDQDEYQYYRESAPLSSRRDRYMEQYNVSTSFLLKNTSNDKDKVIGFFHDEVKRHILLYNEIKKIEKNKNNIKVLKIPEELTIKIEFISPDICKSVLGQSLENFSDNYREIKYGGISTSSKTILFLKELLEIYKSVIEYMNFNTISELNITINSLEDILRWDLLIIYICDLLEYSREINKNYKNEYEYADRQLKNIINRYDNCKNIFTVCEEVFEYNNGMCNKSFEIIFKFYKSIKCFKESSGKGVNIKFKFSDEIMNILKEDKHSIIKVMMKNLNLYDNFNVFDPSYFEKDEVINKYEQISLEHIGWNKERDLHDFLKFYSEYEKIVKYNDFFMIDWGMSSGEYNMFSIFSRIYNAISKIKVENRKEIMILLDEVDSSFHPNWQQLIIKEIVDFLKRLYPHIKFQVIITTHSPVLLSDIPKQNVIFLKNDSKEENHKETFAANISTLYYDSFFMKTGSIGELANNCINNLISAMNIVIEEKNSNIKERRKKLVDKFYELQNINICNLSIEQYEEKVYQIRDLINSVGEKIWKYKLNELFDQCEILVEEKNIKREIFEYVEQLESEKGKDAIARLLKELKEKNQ